MIRDDIEKRTIAAELEEPVGEAANLARKLGLEPYPVNYWIVDHDEMNQLIAYDGFQERYPHWRWGMKYDRQQKSDQFLGGKAFEIVNNDDPAHAFLQESNSTADQKAVITHVEAHADFFANNRWFGLFRGDSEERTRSSAMLARHGRAIAEYMADPEIDRGEVERWIDSVLSLEDVIDQHRPFTRGLIETDEDVPDDDILEALEGLNLSEDVKREVFDEEWLEGQSNDPERVSIPAEPERDLLAFLREYGKAYDEEAEKAVEYEPWQRDVLELLREEAYYFAPQKMTKVMNEGWAAYWESIMMGDEGFADADEFVEYADHQARVLNSPGLNPYRVGKELWEYVENRTNRREVVDKLLRVEGVTWRNFHDVIDFEAVGETLSPDPAIDSITEESLETLERMAAEGDPRVDGGAVERALAGDLDYERYPWKLLTERGMAERHYSLSRPQNRGFLRRIRQEDLERIGRYVFDDSRYASVEEALADVDREAGWKRMREIRESHNDVTFIDEFLTGEFVEQNDYFTYEYALSTGDFRVSSTDPDDVRKKLLVTFTNFGKPTIAVYDANYRNRNELLLGHRYNGIMLDVEQAKQTVERVFSLWGRPVNLMTIVKTVTEEDMEVARRRGREPNPTEQGKLIRYDGMNFEIEDLDPEWEEEIAATDVDYDTKPDEWLA